MIRSRSRSPLLVSASLVLALLSQGLSAPAANAHFNGTGQASARMSIQPYGFSSLYNVAIDRAIANWNATSSPADIFKYSNSGAYIAVGSYSDTWYGTYTGCGSGCYIIRLNERSISAARPSNISNFITSVAVHEWGHALNLAHNSVTSIMWDSRNRNTMTTPQSHDVADVNQYY